MCSVKKVYMLSSAVEINNLDFQSYPSDSNSIFIAMHAEHLQIVVFIF